MFAANWTAQARDQYEEIEKAATVPGSRQAGLFKQVRKTIALLLSNPRHPGLHTHAYSSLPHPFDPAQKVFEAYVQQRTPGAYRLFWCYGPGRQEITIVAITPHP